MYRCITFCTAEGYNLQAIQEPLSSLGNQKIPLYVKNMDTVLHASLGENQHAFIFAHGCVSFWNVEHATQITILQLLKRFEIKAMEELIEDDCYYEFIQGESKIIDEEDRLLLENHDPMIQLSLAHALSQSVKLKAFEKRINRVIEQTRDYTKELSEKGRISLSRRKISKKIGLLFREKSSINLHADSLYTPSFFWKRSRLEPYYHMASEYLDLTPRVEALNRRLDVVSDLYQILSDELKHIHSSHLEIIIIILIFIEVLFSFSKEFLHLLQ
jgi:uncharacterized Rmd1/YagE family protein